MPSGVARTGVGWPALGALLKDAGVRDGRLHDARHIAATVLLILGVPYVVVGAITGWEPPKTN